MPEFHQPIAVCSRSFSRNPVLRAELLERFETVRFNDQGLHLKDAELVEYLAGCAGAIIGLERIDESIVDSLPELRFISKYGVGTDGIKRSALDARGIGLGVTGGVNRQSVAELVLCFMLGIAREVFAGVIRMRQGEWKVSGGFQLAGKTVGVIGCGQVGRTVIELLAPFGCTILGNDIIEMSDYFEQAGVRQATKEEIFRECQFVTVHVPYSQDTRHLVGESELNMMRDDAVLINTARGGIVDEAALGQALQSGSILAAASDVFENEPYQDAQLLGLPNFFATAHIGGSAREAVLAMGRAAIQNLAEFMATRGPAGGAREQ